MATPSKQNEIAKLTAAISALQQYYPNETFTFEGQSFTSADLVAIFQAAIKAISAATTAKTAATNAIAQATQATTQAMSSYGNLIDWIKLSKGSTSTLLVAFGEKPKVRKVPTVEVKAAAQKKRQATRAAKKALEATLPQVEEANVASSTTPPSTTTTKS
jgi:hypothetical protein